MAFKRRLGLAFTVAALSAVPAQSAPAAVEDVAAKDFGTEVLNNDRPVAVMFYSEGCPYCRQMEPIFTNICMDLQGRLECRKYNIDQDHDTVSGAYRVDGVPVFGFFSGGEDIDRAEWVEGAVPEFILKRRMHRFADSHSSE